MSFSGSNSRALSVDTFTSNSLPFASTALTFSNGLNISPPLIVIFVCSACPSLVIVGRSFTFA